MHLDHFSLIAGLYNRLGDFRPSAGFLDLVALTPAGILLDAGGGTGRVASLLRSMVKEVVVADLSYAMLKYSASRHLQAVCAPVETLPFLPDVFDRIILVDALHHVMDQKRTIAELWRVLLPGGRLVIVEPDIRKVSVKLIAILEKLLLMRSHFLSEKRILSLFTGCSVDFQVMYHENELMICAVKV